MKAISKVLVVDDEPDIVRLLCLVLERYGEWEVATAPDARGLVELVRREQPDAMLLDVMMPGIDGRTALRELRSHEDCRTLPVIFLTARVQRQDVAHYLEDGAAGVISKPFDALELPDQIRDLVQAFHERHRDAAAEPATPAATPS